MTPSEGLERRSPASHALPDVGQTISKGEPCFFRLLVVARRCRRDGPLSLHVHAHTPRRTSVQARPVLQDLLQAFLTQQYRSHETFQSLMTRTVHRGGRTRHRCFDFSRWTFRGVPSTLKERLMLRFLFASSTLDLMSSLERGSDIVSSVPSKGVTYVASPRVLQAISSSDVSACGSMSSPAHYQLFHLAQWSQSRPLQDVCGRLR